jgi:hypothetical protein
LSHDRRREGEKGKNGSGGKTRVHVWDIKTSSPESKTTHFDRCFATRISFQSKA